MLNRYLLNVCVWLFGLLSLNSLAAPTFPVSEVLSVQNGLPQGVVRSLVQDQQGFVWMATGDGLCRYDGLRFKTFHHDPRNPHSLAFSNIAEIALGSQGRLWVRTSTHQLDLFDPITERAVHVSEAPAFQRAVGGMPLQQISVGPDGAAWVLQAGGLVGLNPNGTLRDHLTTEQLGLGSQAITAVLADRRGHVWLAGSFGLLHYVPETKARTTYSAAPGQKNRLPDAVILGLQQRPNGHLLLALRGRVADWHPKSGTQRIWNVPTTLPERPPVVAQSAAGRLYANGYALLPSGSVTPVIAPELAEGKPLLSLLADRSNVLWGGTGGKGVIKVNLTEKLFTAQPYAVNFQTDWLERLMGLRGVPAEVRAQDPARLHYVFDGRNNLWIAGPALSPYRVWLPEGRFEPVPPTGIEARWLPAGTPFQLALISRDPQGQLWGLLQPHRRVVVRYQGDKPAFTAFPLPLVADHPYRFVSMLADGGRIWLATAEHGLLRADLPTKRLIRWRHNPSDEASLSSNALLCLAQDPVQYNYLWIGTLGSGLCRLDKLTGKIRTFTHRDGLPNNVIYGIRADGRGNLWLSTDRGLCRFDPRTMDVRNYTTEDGLPNDEFIVRRDVRLPDGRLVFGGASGYTAFNPEQIKDDTYQPEVALTALRINNRPVDVGAAASPIQKDINEIRDIALDHSQNFLSFDFAALQFNHSGRNKYRYKLVGLDNDWVYSGTQASATYTNLSPGTYTFIVNAANLAGVWSTHTRRLRVTIEPPVWATWWAYVGYVLLGLGLLIGFVRFRLNRLQLKHQVDMQTREAAQLKAIDEIKSRFFANITHEFRTPLTLIISPLEQVLRDLKDPQQRSRLTIVQRNANHLLQLINQLLDLSKIEAGSMAVTSAQGDLDDFLQQRLLAFQDEANRKQIQLTYTDHASHRFYLFDADKLEKIVNNLISNALKFTDAGGQVELSFTTLLSPKAEQGESASLATDRVRLMVRDTGRGIPAHKLPHIFDRFYQADQLAGRFQEGSGIGLALVKELVELMQGWITVESWVDVGTTFTIEIPCQPVAATEASKSVQALHTAVSRLGQHVVEGADDEPYVLLVEDSDELAEFVVETLASQPWKVNRAKNGREGLEIALADVPDLIISDVLMPEMNGFELCQAVKQDPRTNHIPFMLLTAKSSTESRYEGLTAGADDYLNKPFQVDELLLRVRNRLSLQRRQRQHNRLQLLREGFAPTGGRTDERPAEPTVEEAFLQRVYNVVSARIDDSSFSVEALAEAMHMSRMNLNRKLKNITDMSPGELIRIVRLKRATELLVTNAPISEVAYAVGFETPAAFSRAFKEQYGVTPSEYADQMRRRSA